MKTNAKASQPALRAEAIKFKPANGDSRKTGSYCLRLEGQKFTPMVNYLVLYRELNACNLNIKPLKWLQLPPNRLIYDNNTITGLVWLSKNERRKMGWATEFIEKYGVDILNPNK